MVKHKFIPLPDATVGEVLGLVEIVYSYGGKSKISFLADEYRMELDDLGDVVEMAELLGLITVHEGELHLTVYGEAVSLGKIDDKKRLLRRKLSRLDLYKLILNMLKKYKEVSWNEFLEEVKNAGYVVEDELMFKKLFIGWGNYAEIFEYYSDRQFFTKVESQREKKK